jgi:signal peptidase II
MTVEFSALLFLVPVVDQLSKRFVVGRVTRGASASFAGHVRIRHVVNARAPFARVRRTATLMAWGGTVAAVLVLGLLPMLRGSLAQAGLGAALGGATGNVIDVVRRRAIVDFVDLRVWPVFNLADVAIVAGVVATLLGARVA